MAFYVYFMDHKICWLFRVTDELHVHMCEIKQYGGKT